MALGKACEVPSAADDPSGAFGKKPRLNGAVFLCCEQTPATKNRTYLD